MKISSTQALRHSNVKLTWDDDDPERTRVTRRTLSKKEIDEIDFKDLIMSASSEDEEKTSTKDVQKLRALLLSGNEENLPEGWGGTKHDKADEMEITFTPGLSGEVNNGAKTGPDEETTLERYQRKERERKRAKKAARKERLVGKEDTATSTSKKTKRIDDEFFGDDSGSDDVDGSDHSDTKRAHSGSFKSKKRVKDKNKRSKDSISADAATDAELSLIMDPSSIAKQKHFDMADIIRSERRAEKGSTKHRSKRKRVEADGEGRQEPVDAVEINLEDPRFRSVYSDPRFAIDPTNPQYVLLGVG
jgi:NUC153 domain